MNVNRMVLNSINIRNERTAITSMLLLKRMIFIYDMIIEFEFTKNRTDNTRYHRNSHIKRTYKIYVTPVIPITYENNTDTNNM